MMTDREVAYVRAGIYKGSYETLIEDTKSAIKKALEDGDMNTVSINARYLETYRAVLKVIDEIVADID